MSVYENIGKALYALETYGNTPDTARSENNEDTEDYEDYEDYVEQ